MTELAVGGLRLSQSPDLTPLSTKFRIFFTAPSCGGWWLHGVSGPSIAPHCCSAPAVPPFVRLILRLDPAGTGKKGSRRDTTVPFWISLSTCHENSDA